MANDTRIIRTGSLDPWWNLAVEEYLLERAAPAQCILYLWQNENTVVIGRNQNPWRECRTELLESEGGKLARRRSGGGAVYHDIGNLNFTFIAGKEVFDKERQFSVILDAVKNLGISVEKSGRNDITADGRKFSGNAFCIRNNSAYHHGTILVSCDIEKLTRYLQVSEEKIKSKGVKSVASRVVNLSELKPGLVIDDVAEALIASFRRIYGSDAAAEDCVRKEKESREALEELYCKYSSWKWRYGESPDFDVSMETRFSWGGVEICLRLENGIVRDAAVYSDAMDEEYIASLAGFLKGCRYSPEELAGRIGEAASGGSETVQAMARDMAGWISARGF